MELQGEKSKLTEMQNRGSSFQTHEVIDVLVDQE